MILEDGDDCQYTGVRLYEAEICKRLRDALQEHFSRIDTTDEWNQNGSISARHSDR